MQRSSEGPSGVLWVQMFGKAGKWPCLLLSSLNLTFLMLLHLLVPSGPDHPHAGRAACLTPPCRDSQGRFTVFGEFCWFWWQHCCQSWLLLLCSIAGWGGGADQEELPLTWLCCAVVDCCILEQPGLCGTICLGRGQPASLGSSQELFAGSGSRCAAAVGFLHTQLWGVMQCLVPFLSSSLCRGGRQDVHRGLCLWRWVLDTCFTSCLLPGF